MSVEIYYGRNFIKVGDKCIPLVLHGSSNCTEYIGGREVLERNWSTVNFPLLITREDIHEILSKFTDTYGEWFKRGSRGGQWISKDGFEKICLKAFDDAHTIEEYSEKGYPPKIYAFKYEDHFESKKTAYLRTTEEFLSWYKEYEETLKNGGYSVHVEFSVRGQIAFEQKRNIKFPCVAKCKYGYLVKVEDGIGRTWCKDPNKGVYVFTSQKDIDNTEFYANGVVKFVYAPSVLKEKPFAIVITDGSYKNFFIKSKSRSKIHFSYYSDMAKKFETEKEAQKYIDSIHCDSIDGMKVVKVN